MKKIGIFGSENSGRHSLSKEISMRFGEITKSDFIVNNISFTLLPIPTNIDNETIERIDLINFYSDLVFVVFSCEDSIENQFFSVRPLLIQLIIRNFHIKSVFLIINKCETCLSVDFVIKIHKEINVELSKLRLEVIIQRKINFLLTFISIYDSINILENSSILSNNTETSNVTDYISKNYFSIEKILYNTTIEVVEDDLNKSTSNTISSLYNEDVFIINERYIQSSDKNTNLQDDLLVISCDSIGKSYKNKSNQAKKYSIINQYNNYKTKENLIDNLQPFSIQEEGKLVTMKFIFSEADFYIKPNGMCHIGDILLVSYKENKETSVSFVKEVFISNTFECECCFLYIPQSVVISAGFKIVLNFTGKDVNVCFEKLLGRICNKNKDLPIEKIKFISNSNNFSEFLFKIIVKIDGDFDLNRCKYDIFSGLSYFCSSYKSTSGVVLFGRVLRYKSQ